jgi:hypothetical protein
VIILHPFTHELAHFSGIPTRACHAAAFVPLHVTKWFNAVVSNMRLCEHDYGKTILFPALRARDIFQAIGIRHGYVPDQK